MRVAYWADTHHRIKLLDKFIQNHYDKVDKIVLLGDLFDDYWDNEFQSMATALYLKNNLLYDDKFIILTGNHDNYYRWGDKCPFLLSSGFTWDKFNAINSILTEKDWSRFKSYSYLDGWLASHAGFSPYLFGDAINSQLYSELNGIDFKILNEHFKTGYENCKRGLPHFVFNCGKSRGGRQDFGGVFWQCWTEMVPLPGVNQIVGHTPHKRPKIKYYNPKSAMLVNRNYYNLKDYPADGISVNLDTHNRYFGIVDNGKLTVHRTEIYT